MQKRKAWEEVAEARQVHFSLMHLDLTFSTFADTLYMTASSLHRDCNYRVLISRQLWP